MPLALGHYAVYVRKLKTFQGNINLALHVYLQARTKEGYGSKGYTNYLLLQ